MSCFLAGAKYYMCVVAHTYCSSYPFCTHVSSNLLDLDCRFRKWQTTNLLRLRVIMCLIGYDQHTMTRDLY